MTVAQAYARFMVVFLVVASLPDILRPLTDAPPDGPILFPEAARVFGIFLGSWFHTALHCLLAFAALLAARRTDSARGFAQALFWVCVVLVAIGLLTPDGLWLVPATWPADVASGAVAPVRPASWYGFIPANPADDVLNAAVGLSGFLVGFLPVGRRPWGYWRKRAA